MSVLWIVPIQVLAIGSLFVAFALRRTLEATSELRDELEKYRFVSTSVNGLVAELEQIRSRIVSLREPMLPRKEQPAPE